MSVAPSPPAFDRLLLHDVSWREYTRLLWAFAERRGCRLTYDRGELEIRCPTYHHDAVAELLGRLAVMLTEEMGLTVRGAGSTTLRRRAKRRGLEPDRCWWIANEPRMRGKQRLDLRVDPPPDLAVEVDVSRSSLDRMRIYARLGVPEVWRHDSVGLTFHVLQPNGKYAEQTHSLSFPLFTPADLVNHLVLAAQHDDNEVVRQFRAFVRQRLAGTQP